MPVNSNHHSTRAAVYSLVCVNPQADNLAWFLAKVFTDRLPMDLASASVWPKNVVQFYKYPVAKAN